MSNDIKAMNLARFREGEAQILCTTDLAARGLDFIDVHHVIQFDFPKDILTLLHRFGRTARYMIVYLYIINHYFIFISFNIYCSHFYFLFFSFNY